MCHRCYYDKGPTKKFSSKNNMDLVMYLRNYEDLLK